MYSNHEIVAYIVTLVLLISLYVFRKHLVRLPHWRLLISSFVLFACAYLARMLKLLLGNGIGIAIEHFCIVASALVLAFWCWKVLGKGALLK